MEKLVRRVAGMGRETSLKTPCVKRRLRAGTGNLTKRRRWVFCPPTISFRKERQMHDVAAKVHWHEPTGGKRAGFGKWGRVKTPYDAFMDSEGIPCFRDIGISKVQNLPLMPWKRLGGKGSYIQLHGTESKWGCYLVEVPGRGALNPEKHMFEKIFFVVKG